MQQLLKNKTVVVTRAADQAEEMITLFEAEGANVIHLPVIKIVGPRSWQMVDRHVVALDEYEWVIFTSASAGRYFCSRLRLLTQSLSGLKNKRIAAVGERTKTALKRRGVHVELVPEVFSAEGLVEAFKRRPMVGSKVLIPTGQGGRDILSNGLKSIGAEPTSVVVYRNQPIMKRNSAEYRRLMMTDVVDVLTFTSPSTVNNFVELVGRKKIRTWLNRGCALAVIGDVTASALKGHKLQPSVVPAKASIPNLVEAVIAQII